MTRFDVVNTYGEGVLYLVSAKPPAQDSGVPGLPNFGGCPVFIPTPFNAEQPNSAW